MEVPDPDPAQELTWQWVINASGLLLSASAGCVDLLGFQPHELEGQPAFEMVDPARRESAMLDFQRAVQTRRPTALTLRRRDGAEAQLEYVVEAIICKSTGAIVAYKGQSCRALTCCARAPCRMPKI